MYIQEKLRRLQQWARTGVSLTKLPSLENYGSEESELALLQYCPDCNKEYDGKFWIV